MMKNSNQFKGCCLATDLDGTLIPLEDQRENWRDLKTLAEELRLDGSLLLYVTGRHLESLIQVILETPLPNPDWAICDVGTSIYRCDQVGTFILLRSYWEHLDSVIASMPLPELRKQMASIEGLRLQEQEKQGRFKLSYYTDALQLIETAKSMREKMGQVKAPWSLIGSIDPFTGDGLIDLLPKNTSKASALSWWAEHTKNNPEAILFAGDSGNDEAALTAGYRAILVGNADQALAKRVQNIHHKKGWTNKLHYAKAKGPSGVLEGYRRYKSLLSGKEPEI